jgi:hypothetical protein
VDDNQTFSDPTVNPAPQPAATGQMCGNCQYSRPGGSGWLECHFSQPTWPRNNPMSQGWPTVLPTDWCGQYQKSK